MSLSKVFFLSSEIEPFSNTYNLSEFSQKFGLLMKSDKDVDIRMCQPKYGYISERKYILREVIRLRDLAVDFGESQRIANLKSAFIPNSRVQVYFMEEEEYFQPVADLLYKSKNGRFFTNNHDKFAFFSKTILFSLKKLFWAPEVVVCNDWQMSLVPVLAKTIFKDEEFYKDIKYVNIIHSFDENRKFSSSSFEALGLDIKDFESQDNYINSISASDMTIIVNDIKNPIIKKIKKDSQYAKILKSKKVHVFDIDFSTSDCSIKIREIIKKIRSL